MVGRREFIRAAFAICAFPESFLDALPTSDGNENFAGAPKETIISDPSLAKKLLRTKIDNAIFNDPTISNKIRDSFHLNLIKWGIAYVGSYEQIGNAVDEFKKNNPWDTDRTQPKKITVGSLEDRYTARISRRFHEHYVSEYAKFLRLPVEKQQRTYVEKFGMVEQLIGRSIGQQLGRETTDAQGNIHINDNWEALERWQRPKLDFDHIVKFLGIKASPFVITTSDLKIMGIPFDDVPNQPSDMKATNQPVTAAFH